MEARVLSNDVICVVLHRNDPLAAREAIRPEDLGTSPVVMLGKDSSIRKHMDDALREAGVRPPAVHECPDIHSMIGMIRADAGVGFLSSRVAAQYVADPVVSRPIEPVIRTMTAVLYLKGGAQDVHLASFAEYLQDSLGGSPLPDGGSRTA